ncbi:Uncharacterized protein OS=uncultured bacterium PE=4 SV=1 [Gemmata massiliana]|uniref:Uncharacterized protein n=2 Tax=Gemmata massiliana TaxID=1210884 RepID=A0A6P2DHY4_9BACT|nr:Uncharacterized protein OS=uncultured bacterium PE=4 SV=1 [Gemmata massiliana]
MGVSHEEGWCTTTNPRYLLKLSRIRPNGRKYLLLVCAAVRHLMPGPRTEIANRVLTEIERFAAAQPRKGVQTHIWRDVVQRAIPQISGPSSRSGAANNDSWLRFLEHRLGALSQIRAADVNVVLDSAFSQIEYRTRTDTATEVRELAARLTPARRLAVPGWFRRLLGASVPPEPAANLSVQQLRDEIVSRVSPDRQEAVRATWSGITDTTAATTQTYRLIDEHIQQQIAEVTARACDLIREVFGNPFHPPVIDPAWLQWNHGAVHHIAERIVASGDFTDLPVLGDALEDAGCGNEELLRHCREPHRHVLGCWALDAVRGRN